MKIISIIKILVITLERVFILLTCDIIIVLYERHKIRNAKHSNGLLAENSFKLQTSMNLTLNTVMENYNL